ncbi:MAG: FAD-dependent oxidoreductase [Actinomycetia bacterium]|nr:FAD-dependent oxidoreductase [Actinomycetes bacterium]MCP5030836.1 FAD-dependent oxidoreductase [Actinomycetes bacterium]
MKVVVLGSNFGGLTAALAVKHELDDDVDVTVISPADHFLFNPSLIWLPFGKRSAADITVPVEPTFTDHGVEFVHESATELQLDTNRVITSSGSYDYDYLVIATGFQCDSEIVPGLGPDGNAYDIATLENATRAGEGWRKFLDNPGDIVIGATQGAGCFGAAYEYLFNVSHQLRKNGLKREVKLTYVSPEPTLGHFGIGGLKHGEGMLKMFLKKEKIDAVLDTSIDHVDEGRVVLGDGSNLDFAYSMIMPPFIGQDLIHKTTEISDEKGYVPVRDTYQSLPYDNVYAVGVAAAVEVPWHTSNPVGIPKTGFPTEQQAHVAAKNIASQIRGETPDEQKAFGDIAAVCVMDAGNNGVIILADKMLPPRKHSVMIPGPQAHAMKVAFEKYFLWKTRHGHVGLP